MTADRYGSASARFARGRHGAVSTAHRASRRLAATRPQPEPRDMLGARPHHAESEGRYDAETHAHVRRVGRTSGPGRARGRAGCRAGRCRHRGRGGRWAGGRGWAGAGGAPVLRSSWPCAHSGPQLARAMTTRERERERPGGAATQTGPTGPKSEGDCRGVRGSDRLLYPTRVPASPPEQSRRDQDAEGIAASLLVLACLALSRTAVEARRAQRSNALQEPANLTRNSLRPRRTHTP